MSVCKYVGWEYVHQQFIRLMLQDECNQIVSYSLKHSAESLSPIKALVM